MKFVKNNTASIKTWVGLPVTPNGYREIETVELESFQKDEEFLNAVIAGEAIMARDDSGTNDIADTAMGLRFLLERLLISGGEEIEGVETIDFTGLVDVIIDDSDSSASINIGSLGPGSALNTQHQMSFTEKSSAKDEWLSLNSTELKTSNEAPAIMPWRSQLLAITFTNEKNSVDTDVELWKGDEESGNAATKMHTWEVRDCRVGRLTAFASPITFEAGDKLAVFVRKQGTYPKDVAITYYFKVLADNNEDIQKTYTGDFNTDE